MLRTRMRCVWALVISCLVAVGGVRPVDAAAGGRGDPQAALRDPHGAVRAAVTVVRQNPSPAGTARTAIASPRLPPAVLAASPALRRIDAVVIAEAVRGLAGHTSAQLAIRGARGPPAR
jgi:hypothetical protein